MTQVRWDPPGPGTWLLDRSHASTTPTPIARRLMTVSLEEGLAEGLALFGSPMRTMQVRWVHGRLYRRLVPLIDGGDRRPPPTPVLWLVTRLHPEFRRRRRAAERALEQRLWRRELERWETEWRPALVARNLELQDVELFHLDDDGLADHLDEVHRHAIRSAKLHHRLHVSDLGPIGRLLVRLEAWGIDASDGFRLLAGSSPATAAPSGTLARLAALLTEAGVHPVTLDDVRAAGPEAAALLDDHLRDHGWRLVTGYDVADRCLVELPELILHGIAAGPATVASEDPAARLRALVPESDRELFDDLLADARALYGLRDENGPLTYEWPVGLVRRALLAVGDRLARQERLAAADDVFELEVDELVAILRRGTAPDRDEIARRAAERASWAALEAPTVLGPEQAPPPLDALPGPLAESTRAIQAVVAQLESTAVEPLTGIGVGGIPYLGRALVVASAADALDLEPGDVLVAPFTAPTYNTVLAMAGAVVVEQGGLLCHAAVIARELGIPAVVGAVDAMSRIATGDVVRVDPVAGRVTVVEPAPIAAKSGL